MTANEAADRLRQWIDGGGPHLEFQEIRDLFHAAVAQMERSAGATPTADDIRAAIDAACSLNNPRLSEVDWAEVARLLDAAPSSGVAS